VTASAFVDLWRAPASWLRRRFKYFGSFSGGGTPAKDRPEYWTGAIPWVSPKDMKTSTILDTEDHISAAAVADSATKLVPPGALLMVARSGILQHSVPTAVNAVAVTLNQDMRAFRPAAACSPRFVHYIVEGHQPLLLSLWRKEGATVESLEARLVEDTILALPGIRTQEKIAAFLDRKTAALDQLIQKKERLIELLQEKRQAFITQAVTKGLDPSAPMKDSGVEWLGQIPAHWAVSRLKHQMAEVVDCPHSTPEYSADGQFPAVRTADLEWGCLSLESALRVSEEIYRSRIDRLVPVENDILYSREGERFGMAALVPPGVRLCLGQRMMLFRVQAAASPAYLMWVLNSQAVYQQVKQDTVGATSPRINIPTITNAYVPVPPTREQEAIAARAATLQVVIGRCANAIARSVVQLAEYRQALISDAVTGQIDVSNEAA
jgi:type I restriction enzyme S subunit